MGVELRNIERDVKIRKLMEATALVILLENEAFIGFVL
jgi:hypothetical protein